MMPLTQRFTIIALVVFMLCLGIAELLKPKATTIDPSLQTICLHWQAEMSNAGLDWRRGWQSLRKVSVVPAGKLVGCANHWTGEVTISEEQLLKGPYSTAAVVYHELGHFCFGLEHGTGIMEPVESRTEEQWQEEWVELVQQYVQECKGN